VCVKVSEKAKLLMTMIEPEVADVVVGKWESLGGAPKNIFCKQYDVGRNRAKPTTDFLMYAGDTKSAHVCLLICCVFSVFWTADLICACFVFLSFSVPDVAISVCLSVVFFSPFLEVQNLTTTQTRGIAHLNHNIRVQCLTRIWHSDKTLMTPTPTRRPQRRTTPQREVLSAAS